VTLSIVVAAVCQPCTGTTWSIYRTFRAVSAPKVARFDLICIRAPGARNFSRWGERQVRWEAQLDAVLFSQIHHFGALVYDMTAVHIQE
jgi:hypothetical protein